MVAAGILTGPVKAQTNCPNGENYAPCVCYYANREYEVGCDQVLMEDVLSVFKRTTPSNMTTLTIYTSANDASIDAIITIPKDLLNEHQVHSEIRIYNPNSSYLLQIDQEAFRSSRNFTTECYLGDSDLSRLDFKFLTGFDELSILTVGYASNAHLANWTSLPQLPNLKTLTIYDSTGLNDWTTFPPFIRDLENLKLFSNKIQSVAMDRILSWAVSHSASTLQSLLIDGNDLTSIPRQIPEFTSMIKLYMDGQKTGIPLIPSGSIKLSVPDSYVYLSANKIAIIEPGAFQG